LKSSFFVDLSPSLACKAAGTANFPLQDKSVGNLPKNADSPLHWLLCPQLLLPSSNQVSTLFSMLLLDIGIRFDLVNLQSRDKELLTGNRK
jgi:hypothetical protein